MGHFVTKNSVKNGQKHIFSKVILDHLGCSNKCFSACFEPVVTHFGPWKLQECLEIVPLRDRKWVKNGSKCAFQK